MSLKNKRKNSGVFDLVTRFERLHHISRERGNNNNNSNNKSNNNTSMSSINRRRWSTRPSTAPSSSSAAPSSSAPSRSHLLQRSASLPCDRSCDTYENVIDEEKKGNETKDRNESMPTSETQEQQSPASLSLSSLSSSSSLLSYNKVKVKNAKNENNFEKRNNKNENNITDNNNNNIDKNRKHKNITISVEEKERIKNRLLDDELSPFGTSNILRTEGSASDTELDVSPVHVNHNHQEVPFQHISTDKELDEIEDEQQNEDYSNITNNDSNRREKRPKNDESFNNNNNDNDSFDSISNRITNESIYRWQAFHRSTVTPHPLPSASSSSYSTSGSSSTIYINVGGKIYETTYGTISSQGENFFTALWDGQIPAMKDRNGIVFVDRSPKLFEILLNFLRSDRLDIPSGISHHTVRAEADFYCIDISPALDQYFRNIVEGTYAYIPNGHNWRMETVVLYIEHDKYHLDRLWITGYLWGRPFMDRQMFEVSADGRRLTFDWKESPLLDRVSVDVTLMGTWILVEKRGVFNSAYEVPLLTAQQPTRTSTCHGRRQLTANASLSASFSVIADAILPFGKEFRYENKSPLKFMDFPSMKVSAGLDHMGPGPHEFSRRGPYFIHWGRNFVFLKNSSVLLRFEKDRDYCIEYKRV